uniref:PX domain-containing protein n=1 Tax=Globisporangium ultimum (strain ATCC 200006 / CBS 805.95 / DAOM BR144) TaxID=431595 RepID=K3WK53_GLOUD
MDHFALQRHHASSNVSSHSSSASSRRKIHIDEFTRAATGVWYYRVDITVYTDCSNGSSGTLDEPSDYYNSDFDEDRVSDISGYASPRVAPSEPDAQYYSVLRRYNDFLHLYERIKSYLATMSQENSLLDVKDSSSNNNTLPAFPQKEFISSSVFGTLWRMSPSKHVLEDRRAKFQALLQWVEQHPIARRTPAYTEFLGQPPQCRDGYVSLNEYTSQHWLSSLRQITKDVKERKRHYTMDADNLSLLIEASKPRRAAQAQGFLGKRRRRARAGTNNSKFGLQYQGLSAAPGAQDERPNALRRDIAQGESTRHPSLKKSKSFHRPLGLAQVAV